MLKTVGAKIIRHRVLILVTLIGLTAFFGYHASKIELSYTYARALPVNDPAYIQYEKFKQLYGEDGSILVIGFQDKDIFTLKKFNDWYDLSDKIKSIPGIKDVLSLGKLYTIVRNDSLSRFDFSPIIKKKPSTQEELDSLKEIILSLPFYEGMVINSKTNATLMAVTFNKDSLNSKSRLSIVQKIREDGEKFGKENNLDIHFSGMPYVRTEFMRKVRDEMGLFLLMGIVLTAVILWLFFRSFNAVFFSIIVVLVGVIWSLGIIHFFGYKITILSGLIPPLILIIGVPNCIFLINKYQEELMAHGHKARALQRTISKVALSNFLANVTTAIGFGVFYFTNSTILMEFGLTAAVNVLTTYVISHILIPIIFSYLPKPTVKHTKHLHGKRINLILDWIINLVHNRRKVIYFSLAVITLVSFYGMTRIKIIGYVVDDLPQKDPVYTHLRFFEKHFRGVLPFEINIDTKKENGVFADNARTLYKIQSFQKALENDTSLSRPISIVEALKFAFQSYKDGEKKHYRLPHTGELKKLQDYTGTIKGKENKLSSFMDTTKRFTRISYQMADIGSVRMKELVAKVQPIADSIFPKEQYEVNLTGFSLGFLKSNDYLFHHLFISLIIAILLILMIGMVLFRSVAIILLSKIPCLIPLAITAGVMGFAGIPFKATTILIFSIAFGIASDGTIYILTEYRSQLKKLSPDQYSKAITNTIRETGLSMIYTAVILFSGFAIFIASSFGGTVALGVLVSLTLMVSLFTNLVLLPCILRSLEKRLITKAFMKESLMDVFNEEDDIDTKKLVIRKEIHITPDS